MIRPVLIALAGGALFATAGFAKDKYDYNYRFQTYRDICVSTHFDDEVRADVARLGKSLKAGAFCGCYGYEIAERVTSTDVERADDDLDAKHQLVLQMVAADTACRNRLSY